LFVKESGIPLLLAFPEGRFFLANMVDSETGCRTSEYVEALFEGDRNAFERFQKTRSCIVFLDDDAIGSNPVYFENYGESSPDYCGQPPDWTTCMKDRSRKGDPSMDARATYYGGFSTWAGRGFEPERLRIGKRR
jgi:hypothetical protein